MFAYPAMAEAQAAAPAAAPVPMQLASADSAQPRSESELRAASTRYSPAVRTCYEREGLKADPALTATVDVGLTIKADGAVAEISVDTVAVQGVGMSSVAKCVAQAATTWRFPAGTYAVERAILSFKLVAPAR